MLEEISFRWENDLDSFLLFSIIEFNDSLIIVLTLNSKSVVQDILSIYAFVKISFQNDMKKFKKNLWVWETTSRVNSQRSLKKLFTWNDICIIDTRVYMVNFEIRELCNRVEKFSITIFNYNHKFFTIFVPFPRLFLEHFHSLKLWTNDTRNNHKNDHFPQNTCVFSFRLNTSNKVEIFRNAGNTLRLSFLSLDVFALRLNKVRFNS